MPKDYSSQPDNEGFDVPTTKAAPTPTKAASVAAAAPEKLRKTDAEQSFEQDERRNKPTHFPVIPKGEPIAAKVEPEIELPTTFKETYALLQKLNEELDESTEQATRIKDRRLAKLRSHFHRQQQTNPPPVVTANEMIGISRLARGEGGNIGKFVSHVADQVKRQLAALAH